MPGRYPPKDGCVFCRIVAGDEAARYVAPGGLETAKRADLKPEGVLAFRNRLTWVPVMLIVVPVGHPTQEELWTNPELFVPAVRHALALGEEHCAGGGEGGTPGEGFRLVSNFGRVAHQSQEHGHIHVISRPESEPMPAVEDGAAPLSSRNGVAVHPADAVSAPWSVRLTLEGASSQREMWQEERFPELVAAAVDLSEEESPEGFRFAADFQPAPGLGPPGFFVLGGGPLDLYA